MEGRKEREREKGTSTQRDREREIERERVIKLGSLEGVRKETGGWT